MPTGQASTQARQVVHDQSVSALMRPAGDEPAEGPGRGSGQVSRAGIAGRWPCRPRRRLAVAVAVQRAVDAVAPPLGARGEDGPGRVGLLAQVEDQVPRRERRPGGDGRAGDVAAAALRAGVDVEELLPGEVGQVAQPDVAVGATAPPAGAPAGPAPWPAGPAAGVRRAASAGPGWPRRPACGSPWRTGCRRRTRGRRWRGPTTGRGGGSWRRRRSARAPRRRRP